MSHATTRSQPVTQWRSDQLPPQTTPFIGRGAEVAQLAVMLGQARLVSVTGTGGVGKTRLALRTAARVAPRFTDGVCLVDLSGLRDPGLLAHAVAGRLGLTEQSDRTRRDAVLSFLRDRKLLLILDTCEHLLDACADLAEAILQQTSAVTVLTTSRQPLDVSGETLCPLSPMRVPGPGARPAPGDAVELFARRAAVAVPGFAVTPDNSADVIALCRRLDGIPLALELAAARLPQIPLSELAADAAATMQDTLSWSYGLCTPAEKALWQRLSVFAGPYPIKAAEEVCAGRGLPRESVVETVIGLFDKSLLVREDDAAGPDEPARYRMLDTIREFGARRLAESGAEAGVRSRFVSRYLRLAREFRDHLLDDSQLERFSELRRDHANLQAALGYASNSEPGAFGEEGSEVLRAEGAELAAALFGYWQAASLQDEGAYWLDRALASGPVADRATLLGVRCYLRTTGGDLEEAVADGNEAIRAAADAGDKGSGARAYLFLTHALTVSERYAEAVAAGNKADRQLTALGDRTGQLILTTHMAHAYQLMGKFKEADSWYQRGVTAFGQTRECWLSGWLHLIGGFTCAQDGRPDEAVAAFRRALRAKHAIGDIVGTGFTLEALAMLAALSARDERASWLLGMAQPLWERAGAVLSNNPPLVRLHDTISEQLQSSLGARRFAALIDAGRHCPLPQAVELALGDGDEPPAALGRGGTGQLTEREMEVAALAGDGLSNREIAARMDISKRTVDAHVGHIYAKLGLSSRVDLALWVRERQ